MEMKVKTVDIEGNWLTIPEGYSSFLSLKETEKAVKFIKDDFQVRLAKELDLIRVSAPLVVLGRTGINDHLTGIEKPISFFVEDINEEAEIVQSLAKWKRLALANYGLNRWEGIYTDMNALRPDEKTDNLHSVYVDQWDWEVVIGEKDRNLDFLKNIVGKIYEVIREMEKSVCNRYNNIPGPFLPKNIHFIHSEDLQRKFPDLSPGERENMICREKGAVFIIGIGGELDDGIPHDGRASDYDDWSTETVDGKRGLNGDILVWYPMLDFAMELSSMGIRVDRKSLRRQLRLKDEIRKAKMPFHQRLLDGEFPNSIGGGIGQSRLCMLYLRKAHIGEVQVGLWSEEVKKTCRNKNIFLL